MIFGKDWRRWFIRRELLPDFFETLGTAEAVFQGFQQAIGNRLPQCIGMVAGALVVERLRRIDKAQTLVNHDLVCSLESPGLNCTTLLVQSSLAKSSSQYSCESFRTWKITQLYSRRNVRDKYYQKRRFYFSNENNDVQFLTGNNCQRFSIWQS